MTRHRMPDPDDFYNERGDDTHTERATLHRMTLEFRVETDQGARGGGAFLVKNRTDTWVWIPKSPCAGINVKSRPSAAGHGAVNLAVPEWLAKREGLI